jgi:hypothetical protein
MLTPWESIGGGGSALTGLMQFFALPQARQLIRCEI